MLSNTRRILAILTIIALIVTGTYAMKEIMRASNEFIGRGDGGGDLEEKPVLHDDFDPKANMKDIYVENLGDVTVYVRIKLEEAMNISSYTWHPGSSDYKAHTYNPTANNCSNAGAAGALFHDYFEWKMGGWKYYKPASSSNNTASDTNVYTQDDFNNPNMNIQQTPNASIVTVSAFLAMSSADQKAFIGWIYDTDGYAYWSKALAKGEVTGLLLSGVTTSSILRNKDYYYVINVQAEAVDIDDIPMWTEGKPSTDGSNTTVPEATDDGKEVINIIVGGGGNTGGDGDNTGGGDNTGDNGNTGGGGDNTGDDDNTGDPSLKEIPGLSNSTPVDTILNINGDNWIVLKKVSFNGSNYAMLLKETAISHKCFDMNGVNYEGSLLQKEFTNAYSSIHIPNVLMNNAVIPDLGGETTSSVSYPTGFRAEQKDYLKDIIFPLSYKEAFDWGNSNVNAKLYLNNQRWWLRTPDESKWYYVISINDPKSGSIISSPTSAADGNLLALRPAIWVEYK